MNTRAAFADRTVKKHESQKLSQADLRYTQIHRAGRGGLQISPIWDEDQDQMQLPCEQKSHTAAQPLQTASGSREHAPLTGQFQAAALPAPRVSRICRDSQANILTEP